MKNYYNIGGYSRYLLGAVFLIAIVSSSDKAMAVTNQLTLPPNEQAKEWDRQHNIQSEQNIKAAPKQNVDSKELSLAAYFMFLLLIVAVFSGTTFGHWCVAVFILVFYLRVSEPLFGGFNGTPFLEKIAPWVVALLVIYFIRLYLIATAPDREARRRDREYEEVKRKKDLQIEQENANLEMERLNQRIYASYKALRKEIEAMPLYAHWRQQVFARHGKICEICGVDNNLEIHHKISLYSIIKQNGIKDKYQASECVQLWGIDNGLVICSDCHANMKSSQMHRNLNNEEI